MHPSAQLEIFWPPEVGGEIIAFKKTTSLRDW